MVGVEQHFVQAAPIKYLATFCAHRKVLLFFGLQLFVFVECHPSFRFGSSNAMVCSMFPVASKTRISPDRKHARVSAWSLLTFEPTILRASVEGTAWAAALAQVEVELPWV